MLVRYEYETVIVQTERELWGQGNAISGSLAEMKAYQLFLAYQSFYCQHNTIITILINEIFSGSLIILSHFVGWIANQSTSRKIK
jgi:hypothetical protein